jgi:hypothetical protein
MKNDVFWCSNCLNMSTRNRIEFDSQGRCNACVWSEEKETFDWDVREQELQALFNKHKGHGSYDIIVPVSGGKDGSYVTHSCKTRYGLNPLCVTIHPPLRSNIGHRNIENFKKAGFTLLEINPPYEAMRLLNKRGFVEQGRPLYGWTTAIFTSVIRVAKAFGVTLIMYGEDGEIEYGGSTESKNRATFSAEFIKRVYLEGPKLSETSTPGITTGGTLRRAISRTSNWPIGPISKIGTPIATTWWPKSSAACLRKKTRTPELIRTSRRTTTCCMTSIPT